MADDWNRNFGLSTGERVKAIVVSTLAVALTIVFGGFAISGDENAEGVVMIGGAVALLGIVSGMFVYWKARSREDEFTTHDRAVFVLIGGFVLAAICYGGGRNVLGAAGSEVFGTLSGTVSVLGIAWAIILFRSAGRQEDAACVTDDDGASGWETALIRVVGLAMLTGIGGMLIGCGYRPALIFGACLFSATIAFTLSALGVVQTLKKRTTKAGRCGVVAGWCLLFAGFIVLLCQMLYSPLLAVGLAIIAGAVVLLAVATFWEKAFLDRFTAFGRLATSLIALGVLGYSWYAIGHFAHERYVWLVAHPDPKKFQEEQRLANLREKMLDFEGLVERLEEQSAVHGTVFPIWKDPQQGAVITQPRRDVRVWGVWVGTAPDNHDGRRADPVYTRLPPELRAPDRQTAELIVWVDPVPRAIVSYERGAKGYRQDIQIQVVDKSIPAIIYRKTFEGPETPVRPEVTGSYFIGEPPWQDIADYLKTLLQSEEDTQEAAEEQPSSFSSEN